MTWNSFFLNHLNKFFGAIDRILQFISWRQEFYQVFIQLKWCSSNIRNNWSIREIFDRANFLNLCPLAVPYFF